MKSSEKHRHFAMASMRGQPNFATPSKVTEDEGHERSPGGRNGGGWRHRRRVGRGAALGRGAGGGLWSLAAMERLNEDMNAQIVEGFLKDLRIFCSHSMGF